LPRTVALKLTALLPRFVMYAMSFIEYRTALLVYWTDILASGVALYLTWRYAKRSRLMRAHIPASPPTTLPPSRGASSCAIALTPAAALRSA
jgi:uncharacterized membrane protein